MTRSKELTERSPLRVLDRSIHGGLGSGNLGVACAGAGAGKSAFLVAVALDHLLAERQVLHVALDHPVDRVRDYYDEIFSELATTESLEDAPRTRLEIDRNRRIHAFAPHTFSVERLEQTLQLFEQHAGQHPACLVVDGYDFEAGSPQEVAALKGLAATRGAELWMSATLRKDGAAEPIAGYESLIDVLLRLKGDGRTVHLQLLKEHGRAVGEGVGLDLDPTTLLLKRV
jgi:predicted ATP-dependent serine protease